MERRGLFVALEGIDGAGTTSQLPYVARHLTAGGRVVCTTCEPSRGELGRMLRRYLAAPEKADEAAMALLFAADRLEHWRQEIGPALAAGQVVLCDRYLWSSLAYQTTSSPPLPHAWVAQVNARAQAPDLTLYFEVTPATARARRQTRGEAAERFDDDARQARVAAAYAALFAGQAPGAHGRAVRIDAEAPLGEVTRACCNALDAALTAGGRAASGGAA